MTTRKNFIGAGAVLATLGVQGSAAADALTLAQFDAASQSSAPHKHLFSATKLASGFLLQAMRNTLDAYGEFGISASNVFCVAVLYHGVAIAIAFDDAMWNRYVVPFARKDPKRSAAREDFDSVFGTGASGNPLLHEHAPHDATVASLVADGCRFFVCNNALRSYSSAVATEFGKSPVDVYGDLTSHLADRATIVPAGVWAIHALQERRFTVLETSV
jgi:intracellular sulfur oxidation DsrE/DsrF family protein